MTDHEERPGTSHHMRVTGTLIGKRKVLVNEVEKLGLDITDAVAIQRAGESLSSRYKPGFIGVVVRVDGKISRSDGVTWFKANLIGSQTVVGKVGGAM